MIRNGTLDDAHRIVQIYNHYVNETVVTFEDFEIDVFEMTVRIEDVLEAGKPWVVFETEYQPGDVSGDRIVGYAYASQFRSRAAYRFAVESTVYLDPEWIGKGIGSQLYEALLKELRRSEVQTVIGCIALPNQASVHLHEQLGFEKVGHLAKVGFKLDRWVDVGYWQLNLALSQS